MIKLKQKDFFNLIELWNAKSGITIPKIESGWDIILTAPQSLFITYFRPHLLELKKLFYLFPATENAIAMVGILLSFFYFKKPEKEQLKLIYFSISFILILGILIGITTPVLGAVVRYKIPTLPFLTLLILVFIDFEKIIVKFPLLQKIRQVVGSR